jgi:LysM repeat protein
MKHVPTTVRKVILVLLTVVLLIVTLGTGIASAADTTAIPRGAPASERASLCNYYVKAGDTLSGLAVRYGTTVSYLASVNHIVNPRLIRIGQHLLVPCSSCCYTPPPPPRNPPCESNCWYRVKPGDTLSGIAAHWGVSSGYLASLNHIANPNKIYSGTWLRVPCWPDP